MSRAPLTPEDAEIIARALRRVIEWARGAKANVLIHAVRNACDDYIEQDPRDRKVYVVGDQHAGDVLGDRRTYSRFILNDPPRMLMGNHDSVWDAIRLIESTLMNDGSLIELKTRELDIPPLPMVIRFDREKFFAASDLFFERKPPMYRTARERRNALKGSNQFGKKKR